MSWHLGRLAGFDLETTGVDVETDRIVTACVVQCGGGQPTASASWMADPGIEIPEGASNVHGITTERARAEGKPAAEVVADVLAALGQVIAAGIPIVAMNARYDLTLLDREARRHGLTPLPAAHVVDPLVLDKHLDRFREGSRTLTALCDHYDVRLDGAHSADADAVAACRLAWRMGSTRSDLAALPLDTLHSQQAAWAAEQATSLADYFRRTPGKEHQADGVRSEWPLIPHQQDGDL
ncbi:exonuclease domain-containing protein [Streptomyces sp. H27-H5]|uniref:exonuclease domain-containing protein n=1 Tax=Streptomyces sp. H27-H5 TaxID=2996460 RepID=UPI0022703179|nr:exonuclease domain-containing protein [Streptomyces sp. H27-H5]MCY0960816.1 exonuclease domain-containing protein [Streptomyces sp. H27-H5]